MAEIVGNGTQKALTGGVGDDSLIGADISENLNAGNGDDTIDGGGGDDKINGGAGIDTAIYLDSVDDVTFSWNDSKLIVRTENEGTDSVLNVEKLVFGGTTYTVNGAIARSDTYLTTENQAISLDVLSNDQSLKIGAELYFVDGNGSQLSEGALIATTTEGAEIRLGAGGALLFSPDTKYDFLAHGDTITRTFTYTIGNGIGGTSTTLVTLTIQGTNDSPMVSAAVMGGGLEGNGTFSVSLLDHASDVDAGHTLHTEDLVWDESPGKLPAGFQLVDKQITVDANDSAYDSLAEGDTFTTHFTYYVVDEFGAKAQQHAAITITGKNDTATITGDAAGQVTENTLPTVGGTLVVNDVDTGENVFGAVGMLDGTYGTFTFADGVWGYTLDNAAVNVQALRGTDTVQDTLTVNSKDGTATETITVTVKGVNDAATITGTATGSVTEDGALTVNGALTVTDVDQGENTFGDIGPLNGTYGTFSFNKETGAWGYTLNNDAANVQALDAGQEVYDTLTVKSKDGSTEQGIKVTVTGAADNPTAPWEDSVFKAAFVTGPSDPWGQGPAYTASMNTAFGSGKWDKLNGPSDNVFDDGYDFIWIDGGNGAEGWFKGYMDQHREELESYVEQGGAVYVNAARWTEGSFDVGFGVSLDNSYALSTYSSPGSATENANTIVNGPNGNAGTSWTGSYFSHDSVSGSELTMLIKNAAGSASLAEKSYGEGHVLFGGITSSYFHGPDPQSAILEANILDYAASYASDYMFA